MKLKEHQIKTYQIALTVEEMLLLKGMIPLCTKDSAPKGVALFASKLFDILPSFEDLHSIKKSCTVVEELDLLIPPPSLVMKTMGGKIITGK